MSFHDDARAASEAVYDAVFDGLNAQVSSLSGELAVAVAQRDENRNLYLAQQAQLIALRGDFDAYRASHPDQREEPTGTLFGTTPGQWPVPGVAKAPLLRDYLGPGEKPATFPTSWADRTVDGGVIWFSWKVDDPAWLDRFLGTKPANRVIVGTYHHEPENDTTETAAQYQAVWARALPVLKKHGVLSATCLLGHLTDAENDPWHVPGVDIAGFDRYNPGLGDAKVYGDPVKVFARCLAYGRRKGLPIAFGETGTIVVPGSTSTDRAAWAKKVRDHLAAQTDVPYVAWWNQSKMTIDQPVSDAWFA